MATLAFCAPLSLFPPPQLSGPHAPFQTSAFARPFRVPPRCLRLRLRLRLRHSPYYPPICTAPDPSPPPVSTPSPPPHSASPTPSHRFPPFRTLRKILAALAMLGVGETAYLTFNKLFSSPGAICATQGCLDVLTGPFSSFLGIPLTLLGALSYTAFAYLCIWPLAADAEPASAAAPARSEEAVYAARDAASRPLMLALATAMAVFSAYLVALLTLVLRSMCPYCVFSAALTALIFVLTAFVGRAVPRPGEALKIGGGSAVLSVGAAAVLFFTAMPIQRQFQPPDEPQAPPPITMQSSSDGMRLGNKLGAKKARMFGAYWCSHCYDQKQRFGKKAFSKIEYIECDQHGVNSQYKLCREKRIPGYPTWEIDGELYPGEIDLPELERLVDEKNKLPSAG